MDPQVQGSFIPKKSLEVARSSGDGRFGLFFLIALLVFVASLVSAGGAFLYQQYLTKTLADESKSLALSEGAYDPSVINDLLRIDSRLNQSRALLNAHVAPSALFNFLSAQTLQNVSFSDFTFTLNTDGSASLSMTGLADSFSTVALQSDQFGSSKLLKNVVFSAITVGAKGGISFTVSATIVPDLLLYKNEISGTTPIAPADTSGTSTTP